MPHWKPAEVFRVQAPCIHSYYGTCQGPTRWERGDLNPRQPLVESPQDLPLVVKTPCNGK